MAHFVQLDANNVVINGTVLVNSILLDETGTEQEALGIAFLQQIFGADTTWIQTSYSGRIRGRYAGIGMVYDPVADVFTVPEQEVMA